MKLVAIALVAALSACAAPGAGARTSLIAADAVKGLLAVATTGPDRNVTLLTDKVNGDPIRYADAVVVAKSGKIYFSDASGRFAPAQWGGTFEAAVLDIIEQACTGRILEYDPQSKRTRIVAKGFSFANGVALSSDEQTLFVAETGKYRVWKLSVAANDLDVSKEGVASTQASVLFDNLPGYPDNLMRGQEGRIWLAFSGPRSPDVDAMGGKPFLRELTLRLPRALWPLPKRYGHVMAFSEDGKIVADLQDRRAPTPRPPASPKPPIGSTSRTCTSTCWGGRRHQRDWGQGRARRATWGVSPRAAGRDVPPTWSARSGCFDLQAHAPAESRGDVHQRIEREPRYVPAQQIVHARLRDATTLGRLDLLPAFGLDQLGNLAHQVRPRPKVRRLLGRIGQRIPDARIGVAALFHLRPRISSVYRLFAISTRPYWVRRNAATTSRETTGMDCPKLLRTLVIGDDPKLLAQVSCLLAKKGCYLPIIDGPRMTRQDYPAEVSIRGNAAASMKAKIAVLPARSC